MKRMIYTKIAGTNKHLIIMLHGTGGDELALVDIGRYLDKAATLVGIRGNVVENGMYRYFKRYADGTFDYKNLMEETKLLYDGITKMLMQEQLEDYSISIIGYSNGANIAQNLLKEYEMNLKNVFLFHPSAVRLDTPFKRQQNLQAFTTYGAGDPFTTQEEYIQLQQLLEEANIKVIAFEHEYGHQLIEEEVELAQKIVADQEQKNDIS